jgi:hypothetical protein
METRTVGAVANTVMVTAYAVVAAWRGFRRRRSTMSPGSWVGLTLTLLVCFALIGFGLMFASAVDQHAPWVGAPRSATRAHWVLLSLGSLGGGVLLSFVSLGWFGYGDPTKQFPFCAALRRTQTTPSPATPGESTLTPPSA